MKPYYLINDVCVCCGTPVPEGRQVCRACETGPAKGPVGASLLDLIAVQMGCDFLSDLRSLDGTQRAALAEKLKHLPAGASDLHDWNDALHYLTGDSVPRATADEARAALIAGLTAP